MDRNRIELRPTLGELKKGDPHLQEMIRFIKSLVKRDTNEEVAHNASLKPIWPLSRRFKRLDLLKQKWVPVLAIDVGDIEYEVSQNRSPVYIQSRKLRREALYRIQAITFGCRHGSSRERLLRH